MQLDSNKDKNGFNFENFSLNYLAAGAYTFCLIKIYKTSPLLLNYLKELQGWKKFIPLSFLFVVLIGAICGFLKAEPCEDTPFLFRRTFGIIQGVTLAAFFYIVPLILITYAVN